MKMESLIDNNVHRIGELMKEMKRKLRKLEELAERLSSKKKHISEAQEGKFQEHRNTIMKDRSELDSLNVPEEAMNIIKTLPMPPDNFRTQYPYQHIIQEIDRAMKTIHPSDKMCSVEGCKHKAEFGGNVCRDHNF
jgi:hypothetical protein